MQAGSILQGRFEIGWDDGGVLADFFFLMDEDFLPFKNPHKFT